MQTDSLVVFDCATKDDVMRVIQFDGLVFRVAQLATQAVAACTSSSNSTSNAQVVSYKAEMLKVLVDTAAVEVTALLKVTSQYLLVKLRANLCVLAHD
jgi:hypothetical protein